jgi:enamidase
MTRTRIENIGTLVTGVLGQAPLQDVCVTIEDGVIVALADEGSRADVVIDAAGQTVIPGLVDGHVHPTFGEWTPAQDSIGWVGNYLHGGSTSMVSAGELHVPGLPLDGLTPSLVLSLAITSRHTTGRLRPSGVKLHAGTVLLVPGLLEHDFDRMAEEGIGHVKFIFYDWSRLGDGEAQQYVAWAHERGMVVKLHSGGVSRSGSSRVAGHEVVTAVKPDVVGHVSGGPIPMPADELRQVIDDLPGAAIEVCSSMNYRATIDVVSHLVARGALDRLTLGTDTPGGTGVIPRGMLRNICFLSSVCGVAPADAVAAATGTTARRHKLDVGVLAVGRPADLIVLGSIVGSLAEDALQSFTLGDLPGISVVMVDGVPLVAPRSQQTPPPRRLATVRSTA